MERINILNIIISQNTINNNRSNLKKMGQDLVELLTTMKIKGNKNYQNTIDKLIYGNSFEDNDFISMVKKRVDIISNNYDKNYVDYLKTEFENHKREISELFTQEKLIKDIQQNAILAILNSDFSEKKILINNFSLISTKNVTNFPLINLPINPGKNHIFDLNKDNFIDIALSPILFLAIGGIMGKFIKNFGVKDNELRSKIKNYIIDHEVYFCNLKEDLQGINIHTGDIFINLKYLNEFINEKNEDTKLIVAEKIIFVFLHELNHGLIRTIDIEMNKKYLMYFLNKNEDLYFYENKSLINREIKSSKKKIKKVWYLKV